MIHQTWTTKTTTSAWTNAHLRIHSGGSREKSCLIVCDLQDARKTEDRKQCAQAHVINFSTLILRGHSIWKCLCIVYKHLFILCHCPSFLVFYKEHLLCIVKFIETIPWINSGYSSWWVQYYTAWTIPLLNDPLVWWYTLGCFQILLSQRWYEH